MVRHRLPDDSPRVLLEMFVSTNRPNGIDISEWTLSCTLIIGLLLSKANLVLPSALSFAYWSGQVTTSEWEISGKNMPRTAAQMKTFDIPTFSRKV